MQVDSDAPLRFLRAAFLPDDWIAILLKRSDTGEAVQRVGPVEMVLNARFQSWLRFKNAHRFDVFVSVNALMPGRRSRARESVTAVRHVFLDADKDADQVLTTIERHSDLPRPSFFVRSSEGRGHVLWRVEGISVQRAEALQKHLARELDTDAAATSAAQMTRLPGFLNRKYDVPPLVVANYEGSQGRFRADAFPIPAPGAERFHRGPEKKQRSSDHSLSTIERARRYLAATPPAIQGEHGDERTFRLCCRLVELFGLTDQEALSALSTWNERCEPPWDLRDLQGKVGRCRRVSRSVLVDGRPLEAG